jgi:hypothetical protein
MAARNLGGERIELKERFFDSSNVRGCGVDGLFLQPTPPCTMERRQDLNQGSAFSGGAPPARKNRSTTKSLVIAVND